MVVGSEAKLSFLRLPLPLLAGSHAHLRYSLVIAFARVHSGLSEWTLLLQTTERRFFEVELPRELPPMRLSSGLASSSLGLTEETYRQLLLLYFSRRYLPTTRRLTINPFHELSIRPSPPSLLTTTLSTTRSLILLQLLSRLITFSLNHALLTFASPEVFGTAAIQFDLLGSTLLFLSREGIQGALLRSRTTASDPSPSSSPPSQADDTKGSPSEEKGRSTSGGILSQAQRDQQALNLSLLPLPLFLLLATLILPLYLYYTPSSTLSQPYFRLSLSLHILSNLLELLSEPFHIRLQTLLRLRPRVQAEGAGVIARAVVTLAVVAWGRNAKVGGERALLAFGIGQVVYGLVLLGRFGWEFGWDAWSMWIPRRVMYVHLSFLHLGRSIGSDCSLNSSSVSPCLLASVHLRLLHPLPSSTLFQLPQIPPLSPQPR
jgi:hypothetical protein